MIVLALLRFRKIAKEIDTAELTSGSDGRLDVALALLLTAIGAALFVYLSYAVISRL